MKRPRYEVAQIIRAYGQDFVKKPSSSAHHLRTLQALAQCRTAAMGGHVDQCGSCGHKRISYNSCRNRHCPKRQGLAQERWKRAREADLLEVDYFHLVFTLPHQLNPLCMAHPKLIYHLLFQAAWQTLVSFADDPKYLGATTGMTAVLHTWGQNLSLHPHIHCILPGGGLTKEGNWKSAKGKGKFLFPIKAISKVFRARFVAGLRKLWQAGELMDQQVKGQPQSEAQFRALAIAFSESPGSSMQKNHLHDPNRSSNIWPDIPIGLPSPITGLSKWSMGRSVFRQRTTGKEAKRKPSVLMPMSSFEGFACTSFHTVLSESDTSA